MKNNEDEMQGGNHMFQLCLSIEQYTHLFPLPKNFGYEGKLPI